MGDLVMNLAERSPAPDFALPGSDGKVHRLADYRGRTVVLYFYPKDDTPGCTKEACGFRDRHATLSAKGVVVLGVSRDGAASHEKFIRKFDLPFVLLSDEDTKVMQAYGAWGEKMMYGKPVTGTIRSTVIIGPDGRVLRQWPRGKSAAEHPAEVLAFLETR
jgi:thioredoxin-dependent peroxiredoxin